MQDSTCILTDLSNAVRLHVSEKNTYVDKNFQHLLIFFHGEHTHVIE